MSAFYKIKNNYFAIETWTCKQTQIFTSFNSYNCERMVAGSASHIVISA